MIYDFSPFYPRRPFSVFSVPSRVVEMTLRKQAMDVEFYGPHLILILSGAVRLSPLIADENELEGVLSAGHVVFSNTSCSYTISAGNTAVSSLCIYGFEDVMISPALDARSSRLDHLPAPDCISACALSSLFAHLPPIRQFPASTLSHLTESVNEALKRDPVCGDLTAVGLLYPFLLALAAKVPGVVHSSDMKSSGKQARSCPSSLLLQAIDFISKNYASPIGSADLEQAVMTPGTTRTHLSRLFEEAFNLRPIEYLQQYRLHRATLLLERSDISLECIARECGFSGRSYFSAVFTKHRGESPTAFRKRRACAPPSP